MKIYYAEKDGSSALIPVTDATTIENAYLQAAPTFGIDAGEAIEMEFDEFRLLPELKPGDNVMLKE